MFQVVDPTSPREPWLYIAEVEHRVANEYASAIATISLAAARSPHTEVQATLMKAAEKLMDYADAHRALRAPVAEGPCDLATYLRQLCGTLARARLAEQGIRLTLIEQPIKLDADRCWRIGLIVSELITNALRHGLCGRGGAITVELRAAEGGVQCSVTDDGRPADRITPGGGSRIIERLAGELGGRVAWQFGARGTAVLLTIPHSADASAFGEPPRDRREHR